jgi:3-hydroxyisobutyrate dehydrogenase-like beta-hydroxyacid dehydrogenase
MNNRAKMANNILGGFVFSLCTVAICLVLNQTAFSETLGEVVTTMGIQQQLMGNEVQNRIKEPNLNTESNMEKEKATKTIAKQPGIEKLEKVAQKLMLSLQTGKYDQRDFSAVWSTVIPKDANFNDGINTLLKPLFEQYGTPSRRFQRL